MRRRAAAAIAMAIVTAVAAAARGDGPPNGDELFRQAQQLMAAKNYQDACPRFEAAYKLDPGIGGELNVGRCYEEWGKLARALRAYRDAEQQAATAKDKRAARIHEIIAALEPQVPTLAIHVAPGADLAALQITLDGDPVADISSPILVDPGPRVVTWKNRDVEQSKEIMVAKGASAEIAIDVSAPVDIDTGKPAAPPPVTPPPVVVSPAPAPAAPSAPSVPPTVGGGQRIAGIAVGAAGLAGVGVAAYLALSARSNYNDALASDCMHQKNACDPAGLTATRDARTRANIATAVGGVGVAAIAGGVVLYLLAPRAVAGDHALYVAPTSNGVSGIALGGRL